MSRFTSAFGFLLLGAVLASSRPALACRCASVDDATHMAATPIIFSGRALSDAPLVDGRALVFRFEVSEIWKGKLPSVAVVRTPRSGATCGASFEPGETYTVFAAPFQQSLFETGSCQLAPFQSRPEQLTEMLKKYRARVGAWDRRIAVARDPSKDLREELRYLLVNNDWTTAVTTLDALIRHAPEGEAALLAQRGLLNYRLLRLDAARSDFILALRAEPKTSLARRGLAALNVLEGTAEPRRPEAQRIWPEPFEALSTP